MTCKAQRLVTEHLTSIIACNVHRFLITVNLYKIKFELIVAVHGTVRKNIEGVLLQPGVTLTLTDLSDLMQSMGNLLQHIFCFVL